MNRKLFLLGIIVLSVLSALFLGRNQNSRKPLPPTEAQNQSRELAKFEESKAVPVQVQEKQSNTQARSISSESKLFVPVSESEIQSYMNQKADYKRIHSINEREIPAERAQTEKIDPKSQEGLLKIQEALGLSSHDMKLAVASSSPVDFNGVATTRLNVFTNGLQVYGSEIILNQQQSASGLKEEIVADVIKQLPPDLPKDPKILAEDAFDKSTEDLRLASKITELETRLLSSKLMYFPGSSKVTLAWHMLVQSAPYKYGQKEEPQGRWNYYIDATTGMVLEKSNEVHTIDQASGLGGNGVKNIRSWNQELDVQYGSSVYSASTPKLITYDLKGTISTPASPVTGTSLVNFANPPSNNAHGYTEHTLNMLLSFGYNSINNMGLKLISKVNYSKGYANAFWNGSEMTYGDGGTKFFDMASDIGVVSHEINHGFTQFNSKLGNSKQPGGLNESFSDIAGVAAEFYVSSLPAGIAEGGANFLVGDKVIRSTAPAPYGGLGYLRNMCQPTLDGQSIDNFSKYNDKLDVHYTSGIMNKAFCLFSKRLANNSTATTGDSNAVSVIKAAKIFFYANAKQWTSLSTFQSAADGTIMAAQLLASNLQLTSTQIDFLKLSWKDVGITVSPTQIKRR